MRLAGLMIALIVAAAFAGTPAAAAFGASSSITTV